MTFDPSQEKSELLSRRALNGMIAGGAAIGMLAAARNAGAQNAVQKTFSGGTLTDHHEIEQLLYRYALSLDNLDAPALLDCFLPGKFSREGSEKAVVFHRKFEYTVHNVLNHLYTIRDDSAVGVQYSTVCYVRNTAGTLTKFDTYARYENEQLTKQDGRWFFATRKWVPIFSTAEIPVVKDVPQGFWEGLK